MRRILVYEPQNSDRDTIYGDLHPEQRYVVIDDVIVRFRTSRQD